MHALLFTVMMAVSIEKNNLSDAQFAKKIASFNNILFSMHYP